MAFFGSLFEHHIQLVHLVLHKVIKRLGILHTQSGIFTKRKIGTCVVIVQIQIALCLGTATLDLRSGLQNAFKLCAVFFRLQGFLHGI